MSDVVDLIMNDHRELEKIFQTLQTEPEKRAGLVPVMITLLTAHSRAEESDVYPAAKQAGITEDVEHSQKEHLEADQLAADLAETDPVSEGFDVKLAKLVEAVMHHVEEEEQKVLPGMRNSLEADELERLGQAFLIARSEHLGDMPEDITKADLEQQAANAGISGGTSQSKSELKETLQQAAEE